MEKENETGGCVESVSGVWKNCRESIDGIGSWKEREREKVLIILSVVGAISWEGEQEMFQRQCLEWGRQFIDEECNQYAQFCLGLWSTKQAHQVGE